MICCLARKLRKLSFSAEKKETPGEQEGNLRTLSCVLVMTIEVNHLSVKVVLLVDVASLDHSRTG